MYLLICVAKSFWPLVSLAVCVLHVGTGNVFDSRGNPLTRTNPADKLYSKISNLPREFKCACVCLCVCYACLCACVRLCVCGCVFGLRLVACVCVCVLGASRWEAFRHVRFWCLQDSKLMYADLGLVGQILSARLGMNSLTTTTRIQSRFVIRGGGSAAGEEEKPIKVAALQEEKAFSGVELGLHMALPISTLPRKGKAAVSPGHRVTFIIGISDDSAKSAVFGSRVFSGLARYCIRELSTSPVIMCMELRFGPAVPCNHPLSGDGNSVASIRPLKLVVRGSTAGSLGTSLAFGNQVATGPASKRQTSQHQVFGSRVSSTFVMHCASAPSMSPLLDCPLNHPLLGDGMSVLGLRVPFMMRPYGDSVASIRPLKLVVRGSTAMSLGTSLAFGNQVATGPASKRQTSQHQAFGSRVSSTFVMHCASAPSMSPLLDCPLNHPLLGDGMSVLGLRVPFMMRPYGDSVAPIRPLKLVARCSTAGSLGTSLAFGNQVATGPASKRQTSLHQVFGSRVFSSFVMHCASAPGMSPLLDCALCTALLAGPAVPWNHPLSSDGMGVLGLRAPFMMRPYGDSVAPIRPLKLVARCSTAGSLGTSLAFGNQVATARAFKRQMSSLPYRSLCTVLSGPLPWNHPHSGDSMSVLELRMPCMMQPHVLGVLQHHGTTTWQRVEAQVSPKRLRGIQDNKLARRAAFAFSSTSLISPPAFPLFCNLRRASLVSLDVFCHLWYPGRPRLLQTKGMMQFAQTARALPKAELVPNLPSLKVETLQEVETNWAASASIVLLQGGARTHLDLESIAGHLARVWPAAAASLPAVEKFVQHGGLLSLIREILAAETGDSLMLAGHSLGLNVAQTVAECLGCAGIKVHGIIALDPRTRGRQFSEISCMHRPLAQALVPRIRLEILEQAFETPHVPFFSTPQRIMQYPSEMGQEAQSVAEMGKMLADTNHYTLKDTHVWDIAAYIHTKAGPLRFDATQTIVKARESPEIWSVPCACCLNSLQLSQEFHM